MRKLTRIPAFEGTTAIFIGTFMMPARSVMPAANARPTSVLGELPCEIASVISLPRRKAAL